MTVRTPAPARFNPFSAEFRRDPYPLYRALREQRPVHKSLGMWVLTRYADVVAVLRSRDFSAGLIPLLVSRQAGTVDQAHLSRIERLGQKSLVFTDNPDHARLRGLVNRVFTGPAITGLRPLVTDIGRRLVGSACARAEVDAIAEIAAPLPITVMSEWMALPIELRESVGEWTRDIRLLLEPGLMNPDDFNRVGAVVTHFAAALEDVVDERRSRPGSDLISRLLTARTRNGDRLTVEEIVFVCVMCFVAGNETTKSLIGNGLLALAANPGQLARLRAHPDLLPAAVTEMVRYDSPLQMTKRLAGRDVDIGGQRIGAGEQVLLCLAAANRDPAVFARPDEFDIARNATAHLAFGHGMHGCLGGALALLQAEIAFAELLRCVDRIELRTERLDWQEQSFIVRGLSRLPVALRGSL